MEIDSSCIGSCPCHLRNVIISQLDRFLERSTGQSGAKNEDKKGGSMTIRAPTNFIR